MQFLAFASMMLFYLCKKRFSIWQFLLPRRILKGRNILHRRNKLHFQNKQESFGYRICFENTSAEPSPVQCYTLAMICFLSELFPATNAYLSDTAPLLPRWWCRTLLYIWKCRDNLCLTSGYIQWESFWRLRLKGQGRNVYANRYDPKLGLRQCHRVVKLMSR